MLSQNRRVPSDEDATLRRLVPEHHAASIGTLTVAAATLAADVFNHGDYSVTGLLAGQAVAALAYGFFLGFVLRNGTTKKLDDSEPLPPQAKLETPEQAKRRTWRNTVILGAFWITWLLLVHPRPILGLVFAGPPLMLIQRRRLQRYEQDHHIEVWASFELGRPARYYQRPPLDV